MDNRWNFKIDLKDNGIFEKLQEYYGAEVPVALRDFILMANASNPEKKLVMINGEERVFETVLSFNESETEAVTVFDIIKINQNRSAIPFGMDPFGNLFYCSLSDSNVVFFNHEESIYEDSNCTFEQFIASLYN